MEFTKRQSRHQHDKRTVNVTVPTHLYFRAKAKIFIFFFAEVSKSKYLQLFEPRKQLTAAFI